MDTPVTEPISPKTETPPKKVKKHFHWLRFTILLLLTVFILLSGSLYWLLTTHAGLRFALYRLPELGGIGIHAKTLKGTIWDGFEGEAWSIDSPGADITLDRFSFAWQPKELFGLTLHINHIDAGNLFIRTKPQPPKPTEPTQFPQSVDLPLAVKLDRLSVGNITVNKEDNIVLNRFQAAYDYDHQRHRITLHAIDTPWSHNLGQLSLSTASPFALNGQLTGNGLLDHIPVDINLALSGSLKDISAQTHIHGEKIALNGEALIHPFMPGLNQTVDHIQIKGLGINPADFAESAPQADLEFDATIVPTKTDGLALEGSIDLVNHKPGSADNGSIPVRSILSNFTVDDNGLLRIQDGDIALMQQGSIGLGGEVDTTKNTLNLTVALKRVQSLDLIHSAYKQTVDGNIRLSGAYESPQIDWALTANRTAFNGTARLNTDRKTGQQTLELSKTQLRAGNGTVQAAGLLELFNRKSVKLNVTSQAFNPAELHPDFPIGNINGNIDIDGTLAEQQFNGKMRFSPSTLSGVPLRGQADIEYAKQHLSRATLAVFLGNNRLQTKGSFGKAGDRLNIDINAPDLSRFGFGLTGILQAQGYVAGSPEKLEINLNGLTRNLNIARAVGINQLDFKLQASPDYARPLNIRMVGNGIRMVGSKALNIHNLNLNINGTGNNHRIAADSSLDLADKPYRLHLAANGGLQRDNAWRGNIQALNIGGTLNAILQNSMRLEASSKRVTMSAARWALMNGSLRLDRFVWDQTAGLSTKGLADNLHLAQLRQLVELPFEHNMVLHADWDLAYNRNASGYLNIRRQSGDVVLPYRKQALGISELAVASRLQNGNINTKLNANTRFGRLSGNLNISQSFGNNIMLAPINGALQANVDDLTTLRSFMPVGQSLSGTLAANVNFSGSLNNPKLNGTLNGNNLHYRNSDTGIVLDKGLLRSRLSGQKWLIDQLHFERNGNLTVNGEVDLANGDPVVKLNALLDRYNAMDRPNARLTVSGQAQMQYSQQQGLKLTGNLKADNGRFGTPKSSMPTLDDDVVIVGDPPKEAAKPFPIDMDLAVDLNDRLYFRGEGLNVVLGGQLKLTSKPGQNIQGIGTIRVVRGKYKAYGQDLNITKGSISFVGPLDNPALNIRAERNLSPVGAGVEVLGNLHNPRVTLVANEPMSDKDKLAWLILNRPSSGSDSDQAALATAAGAFLAGQLNDKIGLVDSFGLTSKTTRNAQTGELNPAEQVLTFSKQLTRSLNMSYEYGLTDASQSVSLIYQLTRALQIAVRAGTESWGGEMKYVIRFD